jgi:hypothetical protein
VAASVVNALAKAGIDLGENGSVIPLLLPHWESQN